MRLINGGKYPAELRQGDQIIVAFDARGDHPAYGIVATVQSVHVEQPGTWCVEYSVHSDGYSPHDGYRLYGGQETVDTIVIEPSAAREAAQEFARDYREAFKSLTGDARDAAIQRAAAAMARAIEIGG